MRREFRSDSSGKPGAPAKPPVCNAAPPDVGRRPVSLRFAVLTGILAALFLGAVSSIRLNAQGLEYDELHQAPAAFAYVGRNPWMFSRVKIGGVPVMNMSYSGAIKSAMYGLYLRVTGAGFGLISWRLTGILIAAVGILCFCLVARRAWTHWGLILFLAMTVSDSALLLLTRFDWGGVALGFLFRLMILAVWLRAGATGRVGPASMFGLGALLGLAIFEKLVAVVLVIPVALLVCLGWERLSVRHAAAAVAGGIVGGLPLLIANGYSYVWSGTLISLADVIAVRPLRRLDAMPFVSAYVGLGQGMPPRQLMLGADHGDGLVPQDLLSLLEGVILSATLLAVALAALRSGRRNVILRWAGALVLAYVAVGLGLHLMPRTTLMHHWLAGTPFQYAAVALAVGALAGSRGEGARPKALRSALLAGVGCLLLLRVVALVSLIGLLSAGRASLRWDPSLTRLGMFAAERAHDSVFVAADWGVGTQMYCLANGRPNLVFELYVNYQGLDSIERWIAPTGKPTLYLVTMRPISTITPETTRAILRDVQASPRWAAAPIESAVADLRAAQVWKFVRQGEW